MGLTFAVIYIQDLPEGVDYRKLTDEEFKECAEDSIGLFTPEDFQRLFNEKQITTHTDVLRIINEEE